VVGKVAGRLRRIVSYRYEALLYVRHGLDVAAPDPGSGVDVRELHLEELMSTGYFKAIAYPERMQARFDRGHRCFGVFVDGAIGNVSWVSQDHCPIDYGLPDIAVPGGIGIYDCFTMPECRGRGAFTSVIAVMCSVAHRGAYDRALALIVEGNAASRHVFGKMGFEAVGRVEYRRGLLGEHLDHPPV
jgi:hypothetical protein